MEADTEALLDALDRVREARGSVELFDAIAAGDGEGTRAVLGRFGRHPSAPAVRAWLNARGFEPPSPETTVEALGRHGIDDVEAYVQAAASREATLTRALEEARAARDLALRSANTYALVAALLAVLAIAGWIGLLGLPFPTAPEPTAVGEPDGSADRGGGE